MTLLRLRTCLFRCTCGGLCLGGEFNLARRTLGQYKDTALNSGGDCAVQLVNVRSRQVELVFLLSELEKKTRQQADHRVSSTRPHLLNGRS